MICPKPKIGCSVFEFSLSVSVFVRRITRDLIKLESWNFAIILVHIFTGNKFFLVFRNSNFRNTQLTVNFLTIYLRQTFWTRNLKYCRKTHTTFFISRAFFNIRKSKFLSFSGSVSSVFCLNFGQFVALKWKLPEVYAVIYLNTQWKKWTNSGPLWGNFEHFLAKLTNIARVVEGCIAGAPSDYSYISILE